MASFNKVILLGNCGRDPEVRYLPSGQAVANVSIATSSKWKDRNSGEMMEETQWHRITFYDKLAEIAGEYLNKGSPVLVEGRLKYGKYTGQDGVEKNTTDIIATSMQLLGSRSEGDDHSQSQRRPASQSGARQQQDERQQQAPRRNEYAEQRGRAAPRTSPQASNNHGSTRGGSSGFDDMDDDIPFRDPLARRGYHLVV